MARHTGVRRPNKVREAKTPDTPYQLAVRMAPKILEVFMPEQIETAIRQYPAVVIDRCMVWTGALSSFHTPSITSPNGPRSVMRAVAEAIEGKRLYTRNTPIRRVCDNHLCVNPAHYKLPVSHARNQALEFEKHLASLPTTLDLKKIEDLARDMVEDRILSEAEALAHYYYDHPEDLIKAAWLRLGGVRRRDE